MKYLVTPALLCLILAVPGCRNNNGLNKNEEITVPASGDLSKMIPVAKDIISEIIVKPVSTEDPWELEKVRGFSGEAMFLNLLNKIREGNIRVYDCISGEVFSEEEAKKILEEKGSDVSKIAKLQFTEDWYFNPETNEIFKKVKSVSLGYESLRAGGLPPAYLPYFKVKTE